MINPLIQLQQAQDCYQCLSEACFEGIVRYLGEDILEVNQQFADLFGYTIDELVGSNCLDLAAPEYKPILQDLIEKEQRGHPIPDTLEVVGIHKDGHRIQVELRSRKIESDAVPYHIAVVREVTELKTSQLKLKRLSEASFEGVLIHEQGIILEANHQFAEMFGYTIDELTGSNGLDLFSPESRTIAQEKIASGDPGPYEALCVKKDGSIFPVEIRARMIQQEGKSIRIGVVRDMTASQKLAAQLRESEQLYRTLVEGMTAGTAVIDTQGRFIHANHKACKDCERSKDQLLASTLHDLYPQEAADKYLARIQRIIASGHSESVCEQTLIHGEQRWYQIEFFPLKNQTGQVDRVLVLALDIHEHIQLEQELARKNEHYKKLYENAPSALYQSRLSDGKILMCNTALATMIGFETVEDCLGSGFMTTDSYVDPERRQQLIQALQTDGKVTDFEVEIKGVAKDTQWIAISAELYEEQGYMEGTMVDITLIRSLTKGEKKILYHLMQGKSNKEIAHQFERSIRTIEDHRASIMRKLDVDNIVDLTQKALNLPALQDNPPDS